ncbi:hypothetical protein BDF19DRAFT_19931 [Syncephalis fuscata]|nr:hypothetical protein BDF19DRAFT_19931 [Syncephalis fuscata]
MDTKQPTTEWPTSVNKDITNTLEDEPFNEESEDTLLYKNVSVTPRKTKKNNKVYWITSPPSVALKRVVNESIGKETSDINVAQVVDWIHNKHTSSYDSQVVATSTTSTTSTATTSTTSMTTTTDATRHSSWERLSLSSPTSSSPNRLYSHSSSKKFRYHSPESVQKMFNLIDQMEESKSSTVTTTITTTTPTKSSTTTTLTVSTASTPKHQHLIVIMI